MALSACAPIFKDGYTDEDVYGTACIDITPLRSLNKFFNLGVLEQNNNFFTLINDEPVLNQDDVLQKTFRLSEDISNSSMYSVI